MRNCFKPLLTSIINLTRSQPRGHTYFNVLLVIGTFTPPEIISRFSLSLSQRSGQTMDIETHSEFQEMVELFQDEDREKKAKLTVELEKIKKVAQRVCFLYTSCDMSLI